MEISEIRPGNWVIISEFDVKDEYPDFGMWGPVKSIQGNTVLFENGQSADIDGVRPVPITYDWLREFGFIEDGWTTGEYEIDSYHLGDFKFYYSSFGDRAFEYKDEELEYPGYVHVLQNLYFELTNEELAFDEDDEEEDKTASE